MALSKPAQRLATAGGSDTSPGIGPKVVAKADAVTATSRSRFGTGPSDVITPSGDFDASTNVRDLRPHAVQAITVTSFGGTDTFKVSYGGVESAACTRGSTPAATLQSELRTLTGDALLTATETVTDSVFVVRFSGQKLSRRGPLPITVSTAPAGGAGSVADVTDGTGVVGGGNVYELGTSRYDSPDLSGATRHVSSYAKHLLTPPAIGTITVTDGIDAVHSLTASAGTDGGTFDVVYGQARATVAWDAKLVTLQAAIDQVFRLSFNPAGQTVAGPTAIAYSGFEVTTLDFGDMSTADTLVLAQVGGATGSSLLYDAALTAAQVQAKVDEVAGANEYVVARTSNLVYTLTKQRPGVGGVWSVVATGFTAQAGGGYTLGALVTTVAADVVWRLDYSGSGLAGRPVTVGVQGLQVPAGDNLMLDDTVNEPIVLASVTTGVYGSASAVYTELTTYGIDVFCSAVHRTTGVSYSNQKDAATPAVFASLVPGVYDCVARTVDANGRIGRAETKSFTVASA